MNDATRSKPASGSPAIETTNLLSVKNGMYAMQPLAAAVVAALNPGTAAAQDEVDELRVEEIIVTATRREMNMQDVGQSITAISTDDIAKMSIQSMEDIVRALPGVSLSTALPGRNSVVFRGLSTGTQEYYTDSQVAIYLDEQPITTISQQPELRMIDIHHVESLPGPQGTLFGSSSQSGTMRYITNKPDTTNVYGQIEAKYSVTSGGDPSQDLSAWVNVPVIDDKLAVRAVAYTSHDGGYIDNVLGTTLEGSEDNAAFVEENYNEYDTVGGRIAARWFISDNWQADLSYILQNSETDGSWDTDPAIGEFQHTKFFKEFRDDDWNQASLTLRGDLGFAELTATASFFERDIVYEWDNMVYEQWKDAYFGPYYNLYNSDYTFGTIFNDQTVTRDAYELRLTSQGESRFQWMIGGFYEDAAVDWFYGAKNPDYVGTTSWYAAQYYAYYAYYYLGYTNVVYPVPPTDIGYSETYSNKVSQKAIFGEFNFDVTDELRLTLGARWFEFDRNTLTKYQFPQGLAPFGSFDTDGTTVAGGKESDTVYKLGATYNFTDDVMAFAIYSEGFRLGGENNRRAAESGFVPQTYLPDKVENMELGIKSTLLDGRLQLNVVAFNVQWKDIQINQSGVGGQWWQRGTLNGGKGENKGFDLSAHWRATENLNIEITGSFGDPKYTEDIQRLNDVVPAGTSMVWAYKEKISFWMDYNVPARILGGSMWLGYNHSYEGEKWNNLTNAINNDPEGIVPSQNYASGHLGLDYNNGWSFHLTGSNLWDERNVNALSNDSSGALFGDLRFDNVRVYTRPRTFTFAVSKRFE